MAVDSKTKAAVVKAYSDAFVKGGLDRQTADRLAQGMIQLAIDSARKQGVPPGVADISDADLKKLLQGTLGLDALSSER